MIELMNEMIKRSRGMCQAWYRERDIESYQNKIPRPNGFPRGKMHSTGAGREIDYHALAVRIKRGGEPHRSGQIVVQEDGMDG